MSLKRYAAKRDDNEQEIIDALRQVGANVVQLSAEGVADLLVGWRGENYLMECKTKAGKLTPAQEQFFADWRGQVIVVRSVGEALAVLEVSS